MPAVTGSGHIFGSEKKTVNSCSFLLGGSSSSLKGTSAVTEVGPLLPINTSTEYVAFRNKPSSLVIFCFSPVCFHMSACIHLGLGGGGKISSISAKTSLLASLKAVA